MLAPFVENRLAHATTQGGSTRQAMDDPADSAFFRQAGGGRYAATPLTQGPWGAGLQHAGPPSALLARAFEQHDPTPGLVVQRVAIDILRPIPVGLLSVTVEPVRRGRHVELLAASLSTPDAEVARATAWRVRPQRAGLAAGDASDPLPPPDESSEAAFFDIGLSVGYHTAMEWRFAEGGFTEPGPAKVWLRMRVPLVEGEPPTPLQRVMCAADSGNGVSAVVDPREHLFVNTDLVVHLRRQAEGEWIGMDARTVIEPDGVGLAETVLHDRGGAIGRAAQCLFVAPRRD
jgi:hypothetical protein